jgi:hypothetical protein
MGAGPGGGRGGGAVPGAPFAQPKWLRQVATASGYGKWLAATRAGQRMFSEQWLLRHRAKVRGPEAVRAAVISYFGGFYILLISQQE